MTPTGLPLLDYGLSRRSDPRTSKRAGSLLDPGKLCGEVYAALKQLGPSPEYVIAEHINRERVSVSPRFAQLRDAGYIRKTGFTRINPRSNKECDVWEVAA